MTEVLLQLTLLTILVSLASYRLTRLIVEDDITANWRKRHGLALSGYRCGDTWSAEWPEDEEDCKPEFSSEQPYQETVLWSKIWPWPISWAAILVNRRFWTRAFSCPQCGSVWVCGALAGVAVLLAALVTGDAAWLAGWLAIAPAAAGLTSLIL